jgi:uncharacterized protein (DUF362 family)
VLLFGDDCVAVDATAARLMRIEPTQVSYLTKAGQFLGNVTVEKTEQIGERIEPLQQDFRVIPQFQYLKIE